MAQFGRNVIVKFDYDVSDFAKKAEQVRQIMLAETAESLKYIANVFANQAAKFTPPNIGKQTIEKRFYTRPYLILSRLVKKYYPKHFPTPEDYKQWRAGMVYKVLYTKKGKPRGTAFAYCKTKQELKKLTRIVNRGLSKVMWGKNLGDIGANVPVALQRLMKKSPNLKNLPYNKVRLEQNDAITAVDIENEAETSGGWGDFSKERGYISARKALAVRLRKIAEMNRTL